MAKGRGVSLFLAVSLLANALSAPSPSDGYRLRRGDNDIETDEESKGKSVSTTTHSTLNSLSTSGDEDSSDSGVTLGPSSTKIVMKPKSNLDKSKMSTTTYSPPSKTEKMDDDDQDFNESSTSAPSGSNIFSLLRLAGALLPNLSSSNQQKIMSNPMIQKITRQFMKLDGKVVIQSRRDNLKDNIIIVDDTIGLKPPPFSQRQVTEESDEDSSESNEIDDDDSDDDSDENNGAEVNSAENDDEKKNENGNDNDKQDSDSNGTEDSDYDSDEPPEGDGQGGGVLGLLAGLSGGEDGQSDLGSLLAAVSGIVGNLSGDGVDINALIASGLGLFVGLLSEGEENPGAILASYLLTSLDTLTGGGANNNGAFFGNFISKLVKGTSASQSPSSTSEPPSSPLWTLKMDVLRAVLQFGTSVIGLASSSSSNASTTP